jgi:hypothetical protein
MLFSEQTIGRIITVIWSAGEFSGEVQANSESKIETSQEVHKIGLLRIE